MVQASVKRAVLVGEFFEIRVEVQRRQLPPSMTRQELHFSLVEAKRLQHVWALQVVLGIHFSLQHAKHAVPPGIGECRQVELSNVLPVTVVARLSEVRSEEHTSELQSRSDLVCRLLLEKKKKKTV